MSPVGHLDYFDTSDPTYSALSDSNQHGRNSESTGNATLVLEKFLACLKNSFCTPRVLTYKLVGISSNITYPVQPPKSLFLPSSI